MLLSFREGADQRMIHTVICGYGHMGKLIAQAIRNSDDMVICGILNHHSEIALFSRRQRVDLLLDFSHPDAFALAQRFVHHSGCALLSGTTGISVLKKAAARRFRREAKEWRKKWQAKYLVLISVQVQ